MVDIADFAGPLEFLAVATGATVGPVAGKKVVVLKGVITSTVTGTVAFSDSTGSPAAATQTVNLAAGTPLVLPFDGSGWWETGPGGTLTITGTTAVPDGWLLYYIG
jgi:hypothetical protein